MNKYQLIRCYPGSPELGTILEQGYTGYVPDGQSKGLGSWFVTKDHVENYPEFWKLLSEEKQLTTDHINDLVTIETYRSGGPGGQHTNAGEPGIKLICSEFKFIVDCSYYRSAYQNKEICVESLQMFLNKLPQSLQDYYINEHLVQKSK